MSCKDEVRKYIRKINKKKIVQEIDKTKGKKDERFNTWAVSNKILKDLFLNGSKSDRLNAMSRIKSIVKTDSMYSKVKGILKVKSNPLTDGIIDANVLRSRAISFAHIVGSLKSEQDLAEKYDLTAKEIETVTENGIHKVNVQGLYTAIGRDIAYDEGIKIRADSRNTNLMYAKIGKKAVDELGDLVTVSDGAVINRDFRKADGDKISKNRTIPGQNIIINLDKFGIDTTKDIDQDTLNSLYRVPDSDKKDDAINNAIDTSKFISRLLVPSNMLMPFSTAEDQDNIHHYTKITEIRDAVLKDLSDGTLEVDKKLFPLFRHMSEKESIYVKAIKNNPKIDKFIFGVEPKTNIEDLKASKLGKTLSGNTPIVDFLEHLDEMENSELNYLFEVVKNDRQHLVQTVLNYQSDKNFSRYVVRPKEYQFNINDEENYNHFIEDLLDNSKLPYETKEESANALVNYGVNSDLDDIMKNYNDVFLEGDGKSKLDFISYLSSNKLIGEEKIFGEATDFINNHSSVWHLLHTLEGINAIRNVDSDGTVTTNYATSPDATASGGMITFAQLLGKNKKVDELFKKLGVLDGGKVSMDDIYQILTDAIDKAVNTKSINKIMIKEFEEVKVLLDEIKLYSKARDMSKPMTMVFIYQQGLDGAKKSVGKEMGEAMMEQATQENFEYIKSILVKNHPEVKNMTSIYSLKNIKGAVKTLSDHYGENVVKPLFSLLDQNINQKYLKDSVEFKTKVYTAMEEAFDKSTKNEKILIIPPNAMEDLGYPEGEDYAKNLKKYGVPLMKLREFIDDGVLVNKEFTNIINAMVNPQHMIDSAVLIEALKNTYKVIGNTNGNMPIHDANRGTVMFNVVLQSEYKKAFQKINSNYDLDEELINAYEAMSKSNPDLVKKFRNEISGLAESKRNILKTMNMSGSKIFGHDTDINYAKPKPKSKSKSEKTIEPKTEKTIDSKTKQTIEPNSEKTIESNSKSKSNSKPKSEPTIESKPKSEPTATPKKEPTIEPNSKPKKTIARKPKSKPTIEYTKELSELNKKFNREVEGEIARFGNEYSFNMKYDTILIPHNSNTNKEALDHEIVHFYTAAYLSSGATNTSIKYAQRAMEQILDDIDLLEAGSDVHSRMNYVKLQPANKQLIEFVAIMRAETKIAEKIYKLNEERNGKTFSDKLKKVLENIYYSIVNFTITDKHLADMEKNGFNTIALSASIHNIMNDGEHFRSNKHKLIDFQQSIKYKDAQLNFVDHKPYSGNKKNYSDPITNLFHSANEFTEKMIIDNAETIVKSTVSLLAKSGHEKLSEISPMYKSTSEYLYRNWDESTMISQMKHFLNLDDFSKTMDKNKFLSIAMDASQKKVTANNKIVKAIDNMMVGMSKDKISTIDDVYARSSIFYLDRTDFDEIYNGNIDTMISSMEKSLHPDDRIFAESMAEMYINGNANNNNEFYNSDLKQISNNHRSTVNKLISLYSLKLVPKGVDEIVDIMKNHPKLHTELVNASTALYYMNEAVYKDTGDARSYRGNLVQDFYDVPKSFKNVTEEEMRFNKYKEDDGWKILQRPTKTKYGIVYKDLDESSFQTGAGTNVGYARDDVMIGVKDSSKSLAVNNAVTVQVGSKLLHKIILTKEQKKELGVVKNPAKSLIRSWANLQEIADTQEIRNTIVQEAFHSVLKYDSDIDTVVDQIKNREDEHPWTLKLPKGKFLTDMPKEIKMKYKVAENLSSVSKFRNNVDLVRKDISPWYEGYSEPILFEHSPILRKTANGAKQLIKLTKIHWIIVNVVKLANDAISNSLILTANNVSLLKIGKYGVEANKELHELETLRGRALELRIKAQAGVPGAQSKLDKVTEEIRDNGVSFALYHGMIQSISTDVILKDFDTNSGLQRNIENVFNKLLRTESQEDLNGLGKVIMKFSKWGIGADHVLNYISEVSGRTKFTKPLEKILKDMSEDIDKIKKEEDIAKYASQYIASPDSVITKAGSAITQHIDIIPRIILFKDLIDKGNSEEYAVNYVLESFVDYKVNMPKELKVLSDYGVLLFPSYWMRIQKIILTIGKKAPASLLTGLAIQELTGMDLPTIVDSNVISKFSNDQILNLIELELLPTKIFG